MELEFNGRNVIMASLKSIAQREAETIRDGIAWVVVYKDGKSWESLELCSDVWNGAFEAFEQEAIAEVLEADEGAVVLNGYYCGKLGEGESIKELESGIRWHYENGCNLLQDYFSNVEI